MRYFWHGAFVGSFLLAPWWLTILLGAVLAVRHCPAVLIVGVFFLIDLIFQPLSEPFYFSMPLALGAALFVLLARFLRARVWSGVVR